LATVPGEGTVLRRTRGRARASTVVSPTKAIVCAGPGFGTSPKCCPPTTVMFPETGTTGVNSTASRTGVDTVLGYHQRGPADRLARTVARFLAVVATPIVSWGAMGPSWAGVRIGRQAEDSSRAGFAG